MVIGYYFHRNVCQRRDRSRLVRVPTEYSPSRAVPFTRHSVLRYRKSVDRTRTRVGRDPSVGCVQYNTVFPPL